MRARLAFAVLVALTAGGFAAAVAASSVPDPTREPARLPAADHPFAAELEPAPLIVLAPIARVRRVDGALLYGAYCAQCHGGRGHADGPLAERLGVTVPDLTALAGEGGKLDRGALRGAIARRDMVPHAEAEPWREVLVASYGARKAERMLTALMRHVETLQAER